MTKSRDLGNLAQTVAVNLPSTYGKPVASGADHSASSSVSIKIPSAPLKG